MNSETKPRKLSGSARQLESHLPEYAHHVNPKDKKDLEQQYKKINAMLNNPNVKLPDGGAKLKAKLQNIETLLNENNSTNAITEQVHDLSLNEKPDIRKETVLRSKNVSALPANLLRAHQQQTNTEHTRTARMMSLEESMKLQELQQKDIKLANMRKRMETVKGSFANQSLADDLSSTMNRLRLDPENRQPRPDDDGPSDEEGDDADSDDDTEDEDYERYDDEGFDEEDEQQFFMQ